MSSQTQRGCSCILAAGCCYRAEYAFGTGPLQWFVVYPQYPHRSERVPSRGGFTAMRAEQGQQVWPRERELRARGLGWDDALQKGLVGCVKWNTCPMS